MARLSSEHHPEGPGDQARRKSRGGHKNNRTTTSTKRAASPSVVPEASKRTKRFQVDDHDQLARELEESVSREQEGSNTNGARRNSRQRRHSEPLVSDGEGDDVDNAAAAPSASQPVHGLTPHLQRIGRPTKATRKARQSMPAKFATTPEPADAQPTEVQFTPLVAKLGSRTHRRLRRDGLSEEMNSIHEHEKEDSRRSKDLAELRRRLKDKEEEVQSLLLERETRRLGSIDVSDDQDEQHEAELREARKVIESLQAQLALTPSPSPREAAEELNGDTLIADDDLFMPIDNDSYEVTTNGGDSQRRSFTQRTAMSSQTTFEASQAKLDYDSLADISQIAPSAIPDKISDQAVKRYELEIEQVKAQSAHLESVVRIVGISLQNLQVAPPGATNEDILTELRHGFEKAREALEGVYPGLTMNLTNDQLIPQLIEAIQGMLVNISNKTKIIDDLRVTENTLRGELDSTVVLLSESEGRNNDTEQELNDAKSKIDDLTDKIADLETVVASRQQSIADQQEKINDQEARIHGLDDELEDKNIQINRFRQALDKEMAEVKKMTETIAQLERDHAAVIADLTEQHKKEVDELEGQLRAADEDLANADADIAQKADFIEELQERVDALETSSADIESTIAAVTQQLVDEKALRSVAEARCEEKDQAIYDHKVKIENLEENVKDLNAKLNGVREHLATEKAQREQTEADLDERNQQVQQLNKSIHDAGIQANELRSQLFGLQQKKDQEIATLKDDAAMMEQTLREELETEKGSRQDAEKDVADLENDMTQLRKRLAETENDLANMTTVRDNLNSAAEAEESRLNKVIEDLSAKITALKTNAEAVQDSLKATIQDLNNTLAQRDALIEQLEEEAIDTAKEHAKAIDERNESITALTTNLQQTQDEAAQLKKENTSLAQRVEGEANELLSIMDSHGREADALRATIRTQEATIKTLQDAAKQRHEEHVAALNELGEQIKDLQIMSDHRAIIIATLTQQKEDLIAAFRTQEDDNQKTLDTLTAAHRELLARNEELVEARKARGEEVLGRLKAMKSEGIVVKTKEVDLHRVATGKVSKTSEKVRIGKKAGGGKKGRVTRRQWDSGIGVDEGFEVDVDVEEMVDEGVVG